jgi:four helix bundle protein
MPAGWKAGRQGGHEAGKLENPNDEGRKFMEDERWAKLEVWKLADELAYNTYIATRGFPKEEIYGITSQLRRSALSIPTNIVEGYSRKGNKELAHFINISLGSLAEVKYLIYFSNRLRYFQENSYKELRKGYDILGKMLWRFYEKIRSN